jgi:hypothetical protein
VNYLYEDYAKQGKPIVCGHPELEMGAIELYRVTGDKRHLDLAAYLLNSDFHESLKLDPDTVWYSYTGIPFLQRTRVEGVRAPAAGKETIRPDAKLLFVAGAGWTKKQANGAIRAADAETLILEFLANRLFDVACNPAP